MFLVLHTQSRCDQIAAKSAIFRDTCTYFTEKWQRISHIGWLFVSHAVVVKNQGDTCSPNPWFDLKL